MLSLKEVGQDKGIGNMNCVTEGGSRDERKAGELKVLFFSLGAVKSS